METDTGLQYEQTADGIRILKGCQETVEVLPEKLDGKPVVELAAYAYAGFDTTEIHLPSGLKKIGAYAFYNCESLERIYCSNGIRDLGAGVFTGCKSVNLLDIKMVVQGSPCLKELLSELRQTLRVIIHADRESRLIFPEFYEESVENTPARILETHTHGCGHRYRYCFQGTEFQYHWYDALFPHVQVQEKERLVTELVLGRLCCPTGLIEEYRKIYENYLKKHLRTAAELILESGQGRKTVTIAEPKWLFWLVNGFVTEPDERKALIELSQKAGNQEALSYLMEFKRTMTGTGTAGAQQQRKGHKRFEL